MDSRQKVRIVPVVERRPREPAKLEFQVRFLAGAWSSRQKAEGRKESHRRNGDGAKRRFGRPFAASISCLPHTAYCLPTWKRGEYRFRRTRLLNVSARRGR